NYYLIGGRNLDLVLRALSPPKGVRVSIYSAPEQGNSEFLGAAQESVNSAKLMPLVQKAVNQRSDAFDTIDAGPEKPDEEIVHAIPLFGYSDHIPAVLLVSNSLYEETALEKRIRNVSLVIAAAGVFLGVIVSGIVTTRMSRPINKLVAAATRI